jgi:hypothetical protein
MDICRMLKLSTLEGHLLLVEAFLMVLDYSIICTIYPDHIPAI